MLALRRQTELLLNHSVLLVCRHWRSLGQGQSFWPNLSRTFYTLGGFWGAFFRQNPRLMSAMVDDVVGCVVVGCRRSTHSCGAQSTNPTPTVTFTGGRSSAASAWWWPGQPSKSVDLLTSLLIYSTPYLFTSLITVLFRFQARGRKRRPTLALIFVFKFVL